MEDTTIETRQSYTFHCTPYNTKALLPELSACLEQYTQLRSRRKLPGVWAVTDRLREKHPEKAVTRRTRVKRALLGCLFLAAGVFLLVPGLMLPKELTMPLIAGIVLTLWGLCLLAMCRKGRARFDKAAAKLLKGSENIPQVEVWFDETGMTLPADGCIGYDRFQEVYITSQLLVLIWDERITVLQTGDLAEGSLADLMALLKAQTGAEALEVEAQ